MFAKTTPEIASGFTDIKNDRTSVTGYAVYGITGLAGLGPRISVSGLTYAYVPEVNRKTRNEKANKSWRILDMARE